MLSSFFLNPYPRTLFFIAYRGRRMCGGSGGGMVWKIDLRNIDWLPSHIYPFRGSNPQPGYVP